jgi:hypothetical protein
MKAIRFFSLAIFAMVLILALPVPALAASGSPNGWLARPWFSGLPDQFVFGDNYTLADGETLDGNLWVFGGNATLEAGSTVRGDVIVFGGNLMADGTITGSVNTFGGSITLGETAVVERDVNMTGGSLNRSSGSQVKGNVNENQFNFPRGVRIPSIVAPVPWMNMSNPFGSMVSYLFRAFLVSALAVLVAMFLPRHTEQVRRAAVAQPLIASGMGLITSVVGAIVLFVILFTICLIPVSVLGFILLGIMVVFGWIALGLEVGQRLGHSLFKTEWTLPVAAGVGTLVLTLIADGIGQIPCVGWIAPTLVGVLGLGAVLLTRFGTQPYTGAASTQSIPPAPAPTPAQMVEPVSVRAVETEESEPTFVTPDLPPGEDK